MITLRNIPFGEIDLDRGSIYVQMGLGDNLPDEAIRGRVEDMIARISAIAHPCYMYNLVEAGAIDGSSVMVGGVKFGTGRVITPFFVGADRIALFVATAGMEFDEWLHEVKRGGDIVDQFVADIIGSVFVEAVADRMASDLEREQERLTRSTGNRYSPGYCGWDLRDQQWLFSLLPPEPCAVRLNDRCLMAPIKSVSGFIPTGSTVMKHPYGCDICENRHCRGKSLKMTVKPNYYTRP